MHWTAGVFLWGTIRPRELPTFVLRLVATGAFVLLPIMASAHPGAVNRQGCHYDRAAGERHCHPERAPARDASAPRADDEGVFHGPLVWVSDGDTLRVLVRGREMDVRLADIDAPERDQPYGWEAKLALIDLVRGKHLVIAPRDVDHYGRIVAHVWSEDLEINREMVRQGAAWFYPEFAESDALYAEEQRARASQAGLWSLPLEQRLEPWEWRRRAREAARASGYGKNQKGRAVRAPARGVSASPEQ